MILSKECKASFTLKKLWKKRVDDINIYDGRLRSEILNLLYITDLNRVIERHERRLTHKEKKLLQKTQMRGLVELSKHKMIREFNFTQSISLFKKSYLISKSYTLLTVPKVIFMGIENKIKGVLSRKKILKYEH